MTQKRMSLTLESLAELASARQPPCLSLYQPTHRRYPENQQDPIRFRNLVKQLETSLRQKHPVVETRVLLEPFEALTHDHDFWNHTLDGLAVLGGPGLLRVFQLQRTVTELAVVADSFHTKPLRRYLQSVDRYQVLGLSLRNIQLFEGNRDALDEIDPAPEVVRAITDALGNELTEPNQSVASRQPAAITHQAATVEQAVDGATDKLTRLIESTLGKLRDQAIRRTDPPLPGPELTEPS